MRSAKICLMLLRRYNKSQVYSETPRRDAVKGLFIEI